MTFSNLLTNYRERAGLSKTDLANKIRTTSGYIMNLESGHQKPPPYDRCKQICDALGLNNEESMKLFSAALEERLSADDRKFMQVIGKTDSLQLPNNILEAIEDPIALKALLITFKNKQDIKNTIKTLLDTLPNLSPEKRQAIIALCK